jgi:hypothetical protein
MWASTTPNILPAVLQNVLDLHQKIHKESQLDVNSIILFCFFAFYLKKTIFARRFPTIKQQLNFLLL